MHVPTIHVRRVAFPSKLHFLTIDALAEGHPREVISVALLWI